MSKDEELDIGRPFAEELTKTLKVIVEFKSGTDSDYIINIGQDIYAELDDMGFVIDDVRIDHSATPFLVYEMATTNIRFNDLDNIHKFFDEMDEFLEMTISTVDVGSIDRLSQKR